MKKLCFVFLLLAGLGLSVSAQTTRQEVYDVIERTGGVYQAYPEVEYHATPAPAGYKPFYISHYGRHGSRWLVDLGDYTKPRAVLEKAHAVGKLTAQGEDLLRRVVILSEQARGRVGELTPLGARQHKQIAGRMYTAFPEVFERGGKIDARASVIVRCILSMSAFCERLKELNPALEITRDASQGDMYYINRQSEVAEKFWEKGSPARKDLAAFDKAHTHPERLMSALFNDPDYIRTIKADDFMTRLSRLAASVQNVEAGVSLYDVFQKEELFDLWLVRNYQHYLRNSNAPANGGIIVQDAKPLLRNILSRADAALEGGDEVATLRFGHDVALLPLLALMQIGDANVQERDPERCYLVWSDFIYSPMAANLQIIFFRKSGTTDILVKFLLNEKEVRIPLASDLAPYYPWQDVRKFYGDIAAE